MRILPAFAAWVAACLLPLSLGHADPPPADPKSSPSSPSENDDLLAMTPGIVCRSINGYEDYEVLPNAALTSEEKLLVYFRPHRYAVDRSGDGYHIHLTQMGQVRKRGEKAVLLRKEKMLEYEWKGTKPPGPLYLRNTVALKGLKPGEYEFDITLRDKFSKDPAVTQTVQFRIIPLAQPDSGEDANASQPQSSPRETKKKARRVSPSRLKSTPRRSSKS